MRHVLRGCPAFVWFILLPALAFADSINVSLTNKALKGKALTTEWRSIDGQVGEVMTVSARYADLVVVGPAEPNARREDLRERPE